MEIYGGIYERSEMKTEKEIRARIVTLERLVEKMIGLYPSVEEYERALVQAGELRWVLGK